MTKARAAAPPPSPEVLQQVEKYLAATRVPIPEEPSLAVAREAVENIWRGLVSVTSEIPASPEELANRSLLLSYNSFAALRCQDLGLATGQLMRSIARALDDLTGEFAEMAQGLPGRTEAFDEVLVEAMKDAASAYAEVVKASEGFSAAESESVSAEWMALYSQAVTEHLTKETAEGRARSALRSLMTHLQLGQDEMGRLFGVSGETVRRWERGKTSIPVARETEILRVEAGLKRLLEMFRLDRLPLVVRREAKLFEGETALEWILRGRIDEVADLYEATFRYQA